MESKLYANLIGYSDVTPYEIISETKAGNYKVRRMDYKETQKSIDNRKVNVGGFFAHVDGEQEYTYNSNDRYPVENLRKRKDGKYYSRMGVHVISDSPKRFYDYNF